MQLIIDRQGQIRCLYDETLDLGTLGRPTIARASYVEPDLEGHWWADLAPLSGAALRSPAGAVPAALSGPGL